MTENKTPVVVQPPKLTIETSPITPKNTPSRGPFHYKSASCIPQHFGTFEYIMKDWKLIPHAPGEVTLSPPFTINQHDQWVLQVFPEGKDANESGNVTFSLRNVARKKVRACCRVKMLGREPPVAVIIDSDPALPFPHNSEWDADTGVTFGEIVRDDSDWLQVDGSLHILTEITICGDPETMHGEGLCNMVPPCWLETRNSGADVPTLANDMLKLLDINASIVTFDSGAKIEATHSASSPENPDNMLWKSDITLVSEDERVPCHQCILAARSPVFCEMLQTTATSMKLFMHAGKLFVTKHVHPNVLRAFVHFLYTDHCNEEFLLEDDGEHLCCLLRAASKYQVKALIALCSQYLITTLTVDNAASRLALAHACKGAEKLQAATLQFIAIHSADVAETEGFQRLDADMYRLVVGVMTTPPSSESFPPRQSFDEGIEREASREGREVEEEDEVSATGFHRVADMHDQYEGGGSPGGHKCDLPEHGLPRVDPQHEKSEKTIKRQQHLADTELKQCEFMDEVAKEVAE